MEFVENVKKEYYAAPTLVIFEETDEGEFLGQNYGIAYRDRIVCIHCGHPVNLNDDELIVWKEFPEWVDMAEFLEEKSH